MSEKKDLRPADNERLSKLNILSNFEWLWEEKLHQIKHSDRNQELWSLSKNSFAEGYLLGKKEAEKK